MRVRSVLQDTCVHRVAPHRKNAQQARIVLLVLWYVLK